ncbi:MAG: DNA mismatch endonuclease Vsr [Nitrospira sp. CR2.1]|nr:DNA mismatch endonuclease Vsr [Nitrospira sp. CR2.1]
MDTFTPSERSWIMAQVKSSGNRSTEMRLVALLRKHGITGWRRAYPILGRPDLTFPRRRVVVFVDGIFWHGHPRKCRIPQDNREYWQRKISRNVARDRLVTRTLRAKGWTVIRIWEDSVLKPSTITRLRRSVG